MEELKQLLIDKYTAAELVELLNISIEDILDADDIMECVFDEFREGGLLEDEWSMLNG
jgi:hypothetical protein